MNQKRYHVIMDLTSVDTTILLDIPGLIRFLKFLPPVIDMKILKGPEVVNGIDENPGITGFVLIDYSHISVHTFKKHKEALVDIFSCRPFDKEKAVEYVLEYFKVNPTNARIKDVYWG